MTHENASPENLKRLRKNAKLTQAQVAQLAGLPRATLANMEHTSSNPGIQSTSPWPRRSASASMSC